MTYEEVCLTSIRAEWSRKTNSYNRRALCVCLELFLPVQVSYEEAQSPVVGCRQLPEKVSNLEDDSVEIDTRTAFLSCLSARRFISLLHDHSLALFGQADNLVVVSIQDQWLW